MSLSIAEVPAFDAAAVDAWHATYLVADEYGRDRATPFRLEEVRADLQSAEKGRWLGAFSGTVDGSVAVAGLLETPLLDNPEFAWLQVHTRPELRGRGYGAAMLSHLEAQAAARGRTVLACDAAWSLSGPEGGSGVPVVEWLGRRSYRLGLADLQQELGLPVPADALRQLTAEDAVHRTAYTLRSWVGPVPEEIVAELAALIASLPLEAPVGELHLEPDSPDVEQLRDNERTVAAQGRTKYYTVAQNAAGEVVAYTDLVTSVHEADRAFQWGTLVRRADRGHRLGQAVKAANLALLQRQRPDLRRVTTFNAVTNGPMIALNERLGFAPVERAGEFQKRSVPGP